MRTVHLARLLFVAVVSVPLSPGEAPGQLARPPVLFKEVFTGLVEPVFVTHAGDGTGRLFIVEKRGTIRVARGRALRALPFLDIRGRVLNVGEQGLLGLAFPPGFAASGRFYVYYTEPAGDNVVARFRVTADRDLADAAGGEIVLRSPHPVFANHNGGMIAFGPDGLLYVATGDGGGGGDPGGNAQDPGSLLGKLLRIDPEGALQPYAIPPGNPFAGVAGARGEVYHLGLRNPWRFSFDRAMGDLLVGDVGQGSREEIDFLPAGAAGGANFGWNILEGSLCFPPGTACVPPPGHVPPALEYTHAAGCSVIGGYVHRHAPYPLLEGLYLFADLCGGWVRGARQTAPGLWRGVTLLDTRGARAFSSFGEAEDGAVHVADLARGAVLRVVSPLVRDAFEVPGADADWLALAGSWKATAGGALRPQPTARALAVAAATVARPLAAGRVTARVLLGGLPGANARIVFHALSAGRHRFVRLRPGRVEIGQVGDFGGAAGGIKRTVRLPFPVNRFVRVRVDLEQGGRVRVFLDGAALARASYRFPRAVAGGVGFGAERSAPAFDNVTIWDRFALLP